MPAITIQMGKLDPEKKKELVEKITQTASEITSIPPSSFMIFIEEYGLDSIGFGGQVLSEKMAKK